MVSYYYYKHLDIMYFTLTVVFILNLSPCFGVNTIVETESVCGISKCFKIPKFPIVDTDNCNCFLYGFENTFCVDFIFGEKDTYHPFSQLINSRFGAESNKLITTIQFLATNSDCDTVGNKGRNLTMIRKCPVDYDLDSNIRRHCEAPTRILLPLDFIGSFGSINVMFQNIYCAICHGISDQELLSNLTSWDSDIVCPNKTVSSWNDIQTLTQDGICKYEYTSPKPTKYCQIIHHVQDILDNHCSLCLDRLQGNHSFEKANCTTCHFATRIAKQSDCQHYSDSTPDLTVLFRLPVESMNRIRFNGIVFKPSELCKENENFDVYLQSCREFVCSVGLYPKLGNCHESRIVFISPDTQPFPGGTKYIHMTISVLKTAFSVEKFVDEVVRNMSKLFHKNLTYINKPVSESWRIETAKIGVSVEFALEDFLDSFGNLKLKFVKYTEAHFALTNEIRNQSLIGDYCPLKHYKKECTKEIKLQYEKDSVFACDSTQNQTLLYPVTNIAFNLIVTSSNSGSLHLVNVCFCRQSETDSHLRCSSQLYIYQAWEYNHDPNGTITILMSGLQFQKSEYYIGDNLTAFVCNDYKDQNRLTSFFNFDITLSFLSWTCSVISVVFLLFGILLFISFKELRNLPYKITTMLAVFIIFGQIGLHLPNMGADICRFAAAVTHFCWLASFMWMSSQALNMLITFHPRTSLTSTTWHDASVFRKYCLVCIGLPLVSVAVFVTLDFIPGDFVHANYGQGTCGWMSNLNGSIYLFFVPVATSMIFNIGCFSMTLFYIEKTMASSRKVTGRRSDRNMCLIYLKLSSVMGFSWIFGFLATFVNIKALWYVYVILNGLQGFFIFLSFCINVTTRRLIASKLGSFTSRLSTVPQ